MSIKVKNGAPIPDDKTICSYCFERVHTDDEYVWAKKKNGGYAFMHSHCWKQVPKCGDCRDK